MLSLCLLFFAFLATYLITFFIHQYTLKKNWLDIPNARSSHEIPTPRGGGLSIVIVFLISLLGFQTFNIISLPMDTLITLISSSVLVAAIGFWDDCHSISARGRLGVHMVASLMVLIHLPQLPSLSFFGITLELSVVRFIFYLFFLAWLLNLYNFMDGIDGFASSEAISVSVSAAVLLFIQGERQWSLILMLLAVSVAGFLAWNRPPAKIFMGDACSGFLGFILGVIALMTTLNEPIHLWSWLILLAVFITDASLTLCSRFLKGEKWYQAHCSHAYQCHARDLSRNYEQQGHHKILARTHAHRRVNYKLGGINLLWLFPLATIATFYPFFGAIIACLAYTPLIFIVKWLRTPHSKFES